MLREARTPLITVLFIFVGLFVFTKIFGPIPFSVNSITTNKQNLFTVTGSAEVTAVPETALVSFGVNKNASTTEAAKEEVNKIINQITKDLKSLGVAEKDIKTSNYSINPDYDYTNGRQTPRGYTVNANIDVRLESIERANKAIDVATRDGATQIGNVQFVLDEDKKAELEEKARVEAIKKAKKKAEAIAKAAGIRLGRIVDVQEGSGGMDPRPYYGLTADTKQTNPETPTELNPGENKVITTVTLSYETF